MTGIKVHCIYCWKVSAPIGLYVWLCNHGYRCQPRSHYMQSNSIPLWTSLCNAKAVRSGTTYSGKEINFLHPESSATNRQCNVAIKRKWSGESSRQGEGLCLWFGGGAKDTIFSLFGTRCLNQRAAKSFPPMGAGSLQNRISRIRVCNSVYRYFYYATGVKTDV